MSECQTLFRLGVPDIFAKHRDGLGVGFALELVSSLLQNQTKFARVGYDTVVDHGEGTSRIGALRMRVDLARNAMSCPTSVSDGALGNEGLVHIGVGLGDELAET